jgi:hypothetical protein
VAARRAPSAQVRPGKAASLQAPKLLQAPPMPPHWPHTGIMALLLLLLPPPLPLLPPLLPSVLPPLLPGPAPADGPLAGMHCQNQSSFRTQALPVGQLAPGKGWSAHAEKLLQLPPWPPHWSHSARLEEAELPAGPAAAAPAGAHWWYHSLRRWQMAPAAHALPG